MWYNDTVAIQAAFRGEEKMSREFFNNCRTLDELRSVYKNLLKKFHPDNGGTAEQCAKLNAEYAETFEFLKSHSAKSESSSTQSRNPFAYDDEITQMLYKIVTLPGLDIELCGIWIWIGGNTYQHKEVLKSLGFQWSKAKKLWHWTPYETTLYYRGRKLMAQIRATYGSEKVDSQPQKALT